MESLYETTSVEKPILFRLSFRPFVDYLTNRRRDTTSPALADFYNNLINEFAPAVLVENPASTLAPERLGELFELATLAVLPLVSTTDATPYAFGLPAPVVLYHQSAAFAQLTQQYPDLLDQVPDIDSRIERYRFVYRVILEKCYRVAMPSQTLPSMRFQREQQGLIRYYRIDINLSFVDALPGPMLPPLQQAWIDFANGDSYALPAEPLPIHAFHFEGFSFFRIEDITESETIQQLQDVFAHLQSDTETAIDHRFETALRNLCGQPDLQIHIVPLPQVNGTYVQHPDRRKRSLFLRHAGQQAAPRPDELTVEPVLKKFMQHPIPYLFPNLDGLSETNRLTLTEQGIQGFLLYPIASVNTLLGVLEISSPRPDVLDETILKKLEHVLPLIQELLRYQLHQFRERLERLIKKQFTPLQPAVAWKFYDVAWALMRRGDGPITDTNTARVAFGQLFPFYGAIDIRDSSVERYRAVHQDLSDQLTAVDVLLGQLAGAGSPPGLTALHEQVRHWQTRLRTGLRADDEQDIDRFLGQEVHPFCRRLTVNDQSAWDAALQQYLSQTDPHSGRFNRALQAFDRSISWINATLNDYLSQEEAGLQAIYPHYAERYRTDGLDYTLYAGQSIAPNQPFTGSHRRQFAEWQVRSMVTLARLTHRLLPLLPLPLRTTQLILAHGYPVDISFRHDEHRFDVDGSYSIRYEVLKKRIDKAYVAGTDQRLTQPDRLAVVYSHRGELTDYLPVIADLQAQGLLEPDLTYVDLAPLQGLTNLKALHVSIRYAD